MEQFVISIVQENETAAYTVIDKQIQPCAFEVYQNKRLMAVFEPHEFDYIHICRNPGGLDEEVVVQIAGKIEAHFL